MVLDIEATVAPQNMLGLQFLNATEMLCLNKSQPKYFQMSSLNTTCTTRSLCFNKAVFRQQSVSYAFFKVTIVNTLYAYVLYL